MDNKIEKATVGDSQSNLNVAVRYISLLNPFNFRKHGTKTKAVVALGMVCFFWGTTWVASKEGVRHMPALQLAGIRQFIGGLFFVLFFLIKGTALPGKKDWPPILILTFLNFIMSNGLSTWGVKYISAGLGSIIGAIFPMWVLLIGIFTTKSKLGTRALIGLIIGFTGICVIFYEHLHDFFNPQFRFGIALSLIATWTWAFGMLYTKKVSVTFNPYFSLGLQMVISGLCLFTFSHLSGSAISISSIPWQSWTAIAYLVVFGSLIAFVSFLYALQNLTAEQVSIYGYITPIVAVIFGAVLFGEALTPFFIIGVIITLYGVYLVNKTSLKFKKK